MLMMIVRTPRDFDAVAFFNAVTSIVRDEQNETDRLDYDFNLGEHLSIHYVPAGSWYVGDGVWYTPISVKIEEAKKPAPNFVEYEVNADFLDMACIEVIERLQTLCPEVEIHFENTGSDYKRSRKFV